MRADASDGQMGRGDTTGKPDPSPDKRGKPVPGRASCGGARDKVIVICGPTASGKSELAQAVAERLDGEIVSADSMQVYRGMDIGTAKVPPEKRTVAYHCLDLVDPGEQFSVALFQDIAREAVSDILQRGKKAIVCGGTGLYIQALCFEMSFPKGEQTDNPVREHYRALAERIGPEGLHALLEKRDPQSAALIHPNNVRRVIRAFEMLEDGTTYAEQNRSLHELVPHYDALEIGLSVPPSVLAQRIDHRVDAMIADGLLDEVRRLIDLGFEKGITSPQAIGYKELVPIVKEGLSPSSQACRDAIAEIKTATRRYAKRQRSWLRRDGLVKWVDAGEGFTQSELEACLGMIDCFMKDQET